MYFISINILFSRSVKDLFFKQKFVAFGKQKNTCSFFLREIDASDICVYILLIERGFWMFQTKMISQ